MTVEHVFVLMLENRSFDHLFGFSRLSGTDAASGRETVIEGLSGKESNTFGGQTYTVARGADYAMPADPGHEFPDVLDQLCGQDASYVAPYPPITSSGFVESYSQSSGGQSPAEIMKCFDTPLQLPVLYALAQEYAICDHWYASMPGPTWPNRMFVHGASSGGLDHSPTTPEILLWETLDGFSFRNGTVFDALKQAGKTFHVYSGDEFPMVAALKGIMLPDVARISDLVADLKKPAFPYSYVFIEPSYNTLQDFKNSSSMHPLADVRDGETLVKEVYEALRASPAWERSLLIIIWDEHGGFYDHAAPPRAAPPGDTALGSTYDEYGFTFEQYGVRVPAIVVSPLVPKSSIDHRAYDHASIPATLSKLFQTRHLTARDAKALDVLSLLSLAAPRMTEADARMTLPTPLPASPFVPVTSPRAMDKLAEAAVPVSRPDESVNVGTLPSVLHSAMRQDLLLRPDKKAEILARVGGIDTRADAMQYLAEVQGRLRAPH
jgi:phospholipase C